MWMLHQLPNFIDGSHMTIHAKTQLLLKVLKQQSSPHITQIMLINKELIITNF